MVKAGSQWLVKNVGIWLGIWILCRDFLLHLIGLQWLSRCSENFFFLLNLILTDQILTFDYNNNNNKIYMNWLGLGFKLYFKILEKYIFKPKPQFTTNGKVIGGSLTFRSRRSLVCHLNIIPYLAIAYSYLHLFSFIFKKRKASKIFNRFLIYL